MARINLLPWRAALRKERQTRFAIILGIGLAVTGAVFLGVYLYIEGMIENQDNRNEYLNAEIKQAEKKIDEIKDLEKKRDSLFKRIEVIQKLQTSRPEIVNFFNEIAGTLPEGVYYKTLKQTGNLIELNGVTQSSARVSTLMRNMEKSPWLMTPMLNVVQKNEKVSDFKITVTQTVKKSDKDAKDEKAQENKPSTP